MAGSTDNTGSGDRSLLEYLEISQLNCLNEDEAHTLKSIVSEKSRNTSGNYLLSNADSDEQLLLNIPFNRAVRIKSVVLQTSIADQAPKVVKFLINQPSLGFEDAEDEIKNVMELSRGDVTAGNAIALRYVHFQSVNSLHIFVASNQGGEEPSRIDALDIIGVPVEMTQDLSRLKKQE